MKGSGFVSQFMQLDFLLEQCGGIIQTAQVVESGISKPVFYKYVKERNLEQVAHGIYASQDAWVDAVFLIHLRSPKAVFSHETALFFHDLTDREPVSHCVTVKRGYHNARLKEEGILLYSVKEELLNLGLTTAKTPFGHTVPVYDMERTICDLVRYRNGIEMQTLQGALKEYTKRKDKRLGILMKYAKQFRVEKILQKYLEMLF